jgi:hypothetical protein
MGIVLSGAKGCLGRLRAEQFDRMPKVERLTGNRPVPGAFTLTPKVGLRRSEGWQ